MNEGTSSGRSSIAPPIQEPLPPLPSGRDGRFFDVRGIVRRRNADAEGAGRVPWALLAPFGDTVLAIYGKTLEELARPTAIGLSCYDVAVLLAEQEQDRLDVEGHWRIIEQSIEHANAAIKNAPHAWTQRGTGPMPVNPAAIVDVLDRDGHEMFETTAGLFDWSPESGEVDWWRLSPPVERSACSISPSLRVDNPYQGREAIAFEEGVRAAQAAIEASPNVRND